MSEDQTPTPSRPQSHITPRPVSQTSTIARNANDGLIHSPTTYPMSDFSLFKEGEQDPVDGVMIGSPPMFPNVDGGLEDVQSPSMCLTDDSLKRTKTARNDDQAFTDPETQLPTSDMFGTATLENLRNRVSPRPTMKYPDERQPTAATLTVYTSFSGQAANTYNPLLCNANLPYPILPDDHLPKEPNLSFVPLLNTTTHYMPPDPDLDQRAVAQSVAQCPESQYDGTATIAPSASRAQQTMSLSVAQGVGFPASDANQAAKAFVMPERDCPICKTLLPTLDALCFVCMDRKDRSQ